MLDIFGFTREPFVESVTGNEVFQWRDLREGLKRLAYGLKCRGVTCVLGPSGCGKTTLLRTFSSSLEPGLHKILTIQQTSGTALDLSMHIAAGLGLDGSVIRSRLIQRIQTECAQLTAGRVLPVVVVDEAQYLTNQALQELRLLMTSGLDAVRNFTLILSGHDELEGRMRTPWLTPLRQRITTWVRLGALEPDETTEYLHHRLKIAGVPMNLFSPEAAYSLHQLSSGLIRPLGTLARHALLACALERAKQVSTDHVRLAAEEVGL